MTSRPILFLNEPIAEILEKIDPSNVVLVSELKQGDKILDTDFNYFVNPKTLI